MASSHKQANFSFVTRWLEWIQNQAAYTTQRHEIDFSEGLLKTLYYETDIGSIRPRGAETDDSLPKYKDNPNWKKHISGCYWCLRERTHVQGICCSKECIYYLHEWCVERAELFQVRRFCKRPGCDNPPYRQDYSCCSKTHQNEYTELYKWVGRESLNRLTKKGPPWYDKEVSFNNTSTQYNPFISTTYATESATMDLATELKAFLIFFTDIGPIPRSYKKSDHSASQHSRCANWRADITGCYQCGGPVRQICEYLCSQKCYSIFNEWCRRKVIDANKKEFCEYPGCGKEPLKGNSTCCKEHFVKRNAYLANNECYQLFKQGPHWYRTTHKSSMSTTLHRDETHSSQQRIVNIDKRAASTTTAASQVIIPQHISLSLPPSKIKHPISQTTNPTELIPRFIFSAKLTDLLKQHTDLCPIPRKLNSQSGNNCGDRTVASAVMEGCYWCGLNNTSFHELACSPSCWHLLHEWSVRKVDSVCGVKLCKLPGCGETRFDGCTCCAIEHAKQLRELRGDLIGVEEEVDLVLGPKWYNDSSPIYFSSRVSSFYEFSNTYCCSIHFNDTTWPTVFHFLCSQKLTRVPGSNQIPSVETVRELSQLMESSGYLSCVRPDWESVKRKLTYQGILVKFKQNSILKGLLLRTNNRQLVCTDESTPGDILMDVRGKLRTDLYSHELIQQ